MTLPRLLLHFFMVFFTLQLFLGEAGIVAFVQKKHKTKEYYENITELIRTNRYLRKQVSLNKENASYLMMNAHRVGLLADNEYLIKLDNPILFSSIIYSPGKIILEKRMFYISNIILFIASLLYCAIIILLRLMSVYFFGEYETNYEYSQNSDKDILAEPSQKKKNIAQSKSQNVSVTNNTGHADFNSEYKRMDQKDNHKQRNNYASENYYSDNYFFDKQHVQHMEYSNNSVQTIEKNDTPTFSDKLYN